MKKVFFTLLLLSVVFACKDEKKSNQSNTELIEEKEAPKEVLTALPVSNDISTFSDVSVSFSESTETYLGEAAFLISRTESDSKSSYAQTRKIKVEYAELYRASIIVKKGDLGNLFGLRIQGDYPDRVDAVFDLENGTVNGVKKTRDFLEESANIEKLTNGWYKCSVTAEIVADEVVVFFGSTIGDKDIDAWTVKNEEICNAYIVPSSITLEKVTFE